MGCALTNGRDRKCKDSIGGLKKIYVFPYVYYNRSLIVRDGLTLTSFPSTVIYEFEAISNDGLQQKQNDKDGLKSYSQSLSFKLSQSQELYGLENLLKKDLRIIIEDNNGNLRLLGAYNGVICNNISYGTGGGKSDLNGATFSFEAEEKEEALFMNSLSDTGFSTIDLLLLEDNTFFLIENNSLMQLG